MGAKRKIWNSTRLAVTERTQFTHMPTDENTYVATAVATGRSSILATESSTHAAIQALCEVTL